MAIKCLKENLHNRNWISGDWTSNEYHRADEVIELELGLKWRLPQFIAQLDRQGNDCAWWEGTAEKALHSSQGGFRRSRAGEELRTPLSCLIPFLAWKDWLKNGILVLRSKRKRKVTWLRKQIWKGMCPFFYASPCCPKWEWVGNMDWPPIHKQVCWAPRQKRVRLRFVTLLASLEKMSLIWTKIIHINTLGVWNWLLFQVILYHRPRRNKISPLPPTYMKNKTEN